MNNVRNSNWGRWGVEDERGALNMLTSEHVGQAMRIPSQGKVYSLGAPVGREGPIGLRNTTHHYMSIIDNDPSPGGKGSADDVLVTHCHASTHIDGLCHIWYDSQLYNGHSASEVTPAGAQRCGVQNVDWIITRGVLLDIAALKGVTRLENDYAVTGDDLDAAAKARGVDILPGDVVLFRTGWYTRYLEGTADLRGDYPGLSASAADWITAHDLCAIGADNVAVEIWPPEKPGGLPIHRLMLRDLGGYLIELMNLEDLARDGHTEFLFVAAPLRISGGVGSPINPLAIV